jgi:hypothetical protein
MHELFRLLSRHLSSGVYIGTLINTRMARGGEVSRVRHHRLKVNVGTLYGYCEAIRLCSTGLYDGDHTAPGHMQSGTYTIPDFS